MATTYSDEATLALNTVPAKTVPVPKWGGRVRRFRASITLAAQAIADDIVLFRLPPGSAFCYGVLNSTVTLGSATVAIGITGTTGKYRTAATFAAVDTPTLFGNNVPVAAEPLSDKEDVLLTIATAALPGAGTLVVDLYVSNG